jgi:cytochrome c peroxidase
MSGASETLRGELRAWSLAVGLLVTAASAAPILAGDGLLANRPLPPVPVPAENPQTDAKVRLGAQLYFDPRLSADSTISCATCHRPDAAWANHDPTDTGIRGQVGGRNSGTILDSGHMKYQFWDGRAASLEEQALGPIHNPIEMGETLENVVAKLNAIPGYRRQFQEVFGIDADTAGIAKAIAAFERTIVSGPSPYDRYVAGERGALSPPAVRGMKLFNGKAHCTLCHGGPAFSDQSFHNLGVGMDRPDPDVGREAHTKDQADRGKFKTPGLRNVALTYPYLHDGSAKTLREVIDLYDRGGVPNPNLDPLMLPLRLTERERQDLVAFLESLTGSLPVVETPALPEDAKPGSGAADGDAP